MAGTSPEAACATFTSTFLQALSQPHFTNFLAHKSACDHHYRKGFKLHLIVVLFSSTCWSSFLQ